MTRILLGFIAGILAIVTTAVVISRDHPPRFSLHVGHHEPANKGILLFKIDTTTGQTWIYDTEENMMVDDDFMKQLRPKASPEDRRKWLTQVPGCTAFQEPHWVEIHTNATSIDYKSFDTK